MLAIALLLAPGQARAAGMLGGSSIGNPRADFDSYSNDNSNNNQTSNSYNNDDDQQQAIENYNNANYDDTEEETETLVPNSLENNQAAEPNLDPEADTSVEANTNSSLSTASLSSTTKPKSSTSTKSTPSYKPLEFVSGQDEELKVNIAARSMELDLLKGRKIKLKVNPKALYKTKEKSATYKINLYDTTSGDRELVTTQNITVTRGDKISYANLDLNYFTTTDKDIEIDIYDTLGDLVNTYKTTIAASNLETQTASVDDSADPDAALADCDNSTFGACQLDYIFSKLQFEASKTTRNAAGYTKTRDGSYKVFYPLGSPQVSRQVVTKYYSNGSGSGGTGGGGKGGGKGSGGGLSDNDTNNLIISDLVRIGALANDPANPKGGILTYYPDTNSLGFKIIGAANESMMLNPNGLIGIGVNSPTAYLDLRAGTSSTPALRLRKATELTSVAVDGAVEYDGKLWLTQGTERKQVATTDLLPNMSNLPAGGLTGTLPGGVIPSYVVKVSDVQTIWNKAIVDSTLQNVSTSSNFTVGGNLFFTGSSYANGKILVSDSNGQADWQIHDEWSLNSDNGDTVDALYIHDGGRVGINDLTADYLLDVNGTLGVAGNTTLGGTLAVASDTAIAGTLGVTGASTLSSTLAVTGATTLSSTLDVTGNTVLNGNLNTNGDTSLDGSLRIGSGGSRDFATNNGDLYIEGVLEVDGDIHLGDVLADTLTVEASMIAKGGISAQNGINMNNNLIVNIGAAETDFTNGGGLILNGDLAVNGNDFFVDTDNGLVAIGDNTPDASLEIVTNGSVIPFMISNGSDGDYLTVITNGDIGINDTTPDIY